MMFCSHFLEFILFLVCVTLAQKFEVNPDTTTECHRRQFTFRASQKDENGKQCWDLITAKSCWGRCDSGEIGDWRFPFKRPFHPVCLHEKRAVRYTVLQNCDPDADLSIAEYEYYEALTCSCFICDSSSTSCQGVQNLNENLPKDNFAEITKPGRILPSDLLD